MKKQLSKSFRPNLESLEDRTVMSATLHGNEFVIKKTTDRPEIARTEQHTRTNQDTIVRNTTHAMALTDASLSISGSTATISHAGKRGPGPEW